MTKKSWLKIAIAASVVAAGACAVVIAAKCLEDADLDDFEVEEV